MIFAIDFDGTIVGGEKFPEIGDERPLATYVMKQLLENGHQIIIWTCRNNAKQDEALNWLYERGVFPTAINCNTAENLAQFNNVDNRKVHADYYLDDKSWPPFTDWYHLLIDMIVSGVLPSESISGIRDPGEN